MTWVRYAIVLFILIIIAIAVIKSGKRDFKIEANKLVELLGGKKNIVTIEASMSRFKATLKDVSLANKDGIQKLGAKGIVEIDNQLKIVFDSDAVKLKKCIEDLLKQNAIRKKRFTFYIFRHNVTLINCRIMLKRGIIC